MATRYLAVVTLLRELGTGEHPDHSLPVPPEIWPGPGIPTPPIYYPPPPVSIWPGPGYPAHPIAPGGPPPGVWPGPGVPTPPIFYPPTVWPPQPGQPPVGIWPPDVGIWPGPGPLPPGSPEHPIAPGGGSMYILVYVPGVGWKYIKVERGLTPDNTLPGDQPHPDQGLPDDQPEVNPLKR
jgi:hypothetical protein